MTIAFLYPLALLGALGIAAPIWLHLQRRRQTNVVRFSTLRFLDDQPAVKRSPLWPRDVPLLLLRVLGLLLLVAAFAWPFLPNDESPVLISHSRVYILDNTLSHQAGERFAKARDEIIEQLERAGPETQIAVVELTTLPRTVVSFGDSRDAAIQRLQSLEPSWQRGSYLAAFRMAGELLNQSLGQKRQVVLLADNQQNQWTEGQHTAPFLENVELILPKVEAADAPNVAVMQPDVRRTFLGDRTIAQCTVRLLHQGPAENATLVFRDGDKEILRREISLLDQSPTITLGTEWEIDASQWLRGEVEVEIDGQADALPGDNRVVFSMPPAREGKVDLLADSPFLRTALSPEIMRGRWQTRMLVAAELANQTRDQRDADVLCVESQYLQSGPARDLVFHYLNQGRGVLLVVDQVTPLTKNFLRELGIEAADDGRKAATSRFRYVFLEHPVFQPFRSADFGNLLDVRVYDYRRLTSQAALPLVFSEQGDMIFFQQPTTTGRLFVSAFALDRRDTNWPLHPTFVPFLDRCLQQARTEPTIQSIYQPGEVCVWTVTGNTDMRELIVRDQQQEALRVPVANGRARFAVPARPGLFAVSYDADPEIVGMLDVNPSPEESYLTYTAEPDTPRSWQRSGPETGSKTAASTLQLALTQAQILQQRIWWWLLLCGLAALMAETCWLAIASLVTKMT